MIPVEDFVTILVASQQRLGIGFTYEGKLMHGDAVVADAVTVEVLRQISPAEFRKTVEDPIEAPHFYELWDKTKHPVTAE